MFDSVIVSTDSEEVAAIARHYGAEVPFLRLAAFSGDTSPDIEWVEHTLAELKRRGAPGTVSVCCARPVPVPVRPTRFGVRGGGFSHRRARSLRAIEKCAQHPGKMWVVRGNRMFPLLPFGERQPWHSTPYQALPPVMRRTRRSRSRGAEWFEQRSIAGDGMVPFITGGMKGSTSTIRTTG